jgi:hypothetical protein
MAPSVSCRASPGHPLLEILRKGGREISRHAVDTDALRDPHHRRDEQGMLLNVDLLTTGEPGFELLGQTSSGSEPANKLESGFREPIDTALVGRNRAHDVAVSASDQGTAIHVG